MPARIRSCSALGRDVHEHDLVGLVEDPVRERLAHANAGELGIASLRLSRCWTFTVEMTSIPAVEHLLDVLIALLVAHPGRVGVRELVDQRQLGRAADDGVDVHLLERDGAVLGVQPAHDLEPLGERRRLGPVVRLEVADHDVASLGVRLPPLLQHAVGLADARRRASRIR